MKIESKAVHVGDRKKPGESIPSATPIYTATTFFYDTTEQLDKVFGEEIEGQSYSRYGNPTNDALEELLTSLENGAGNAGLLFGHDGAACGDDDRAASTGASLCWRPMRSTARR